MVCRFLNRRRCVITSKLKPPTNHQLRAKNAALRLEHRMQYRIGVQDLGNQGLEKHSYS